MSYVTVQSVEDMIKAWQEECADHPALYNQANVLRDRLSAINAVDAYDRGRRDMLNALLSPNPQVAAQVADLMGEDAAQNPDGKLPFVVVLWITSVAEQLGIEPKDGA